METIFRLPKTLEQKNRIQNAHDNLELDNADDFDYER